MVDGMVQAATVLLEEWFGSAGRAPPRPCCARECHVNRGASCLLLMRSAAESGSSSLLAARIVQGVRVRSMRTGAELPFVHKTIGEHDSHDSVLRWCLAIHCEGMGVDAQRPVPVLGGSDHRGLLSCRTVSACPGAETSIVIAATVRNRQAERRWPILAILGDPRFSASPFLRPLCLALTCCSRCVMAGGGRGRGRGRAVLQRSGRGCGGGAANALTFLLDPSPSPLPTYLLTYLEVPTVPSPGHPLPSHADRTDCTRAG